MTTQVQSTPDSKIQEGAEAITPSEQDIRKPLKDALGRSYATGKRKNSIARVWIKPGKGQITVNGQDHVQYFVRPTLQNLVNQPLVISDHQKSFDVTATVVGGGHSGQAGALRHGISKALNLFEPDLHPVLKKAGLLTRDSRIVERKKYGKHKARKSPQFSKR